MDQILPPPHLLGELVLQDVDLTLEAVDPLLVDLLLGAQARFQLPEGLLLALVLLVALAASFLEKFLSRKVRSGETEWKHAIMLLY